MRPPPAPDSWRAILAGPNLAQFALVCLGSWLHAADALVTATIMPSVGADLGGYAYFAWAVAGYYTGAILAGATAGRLSEIMGLRFAVAAAGVAYALGCALSALAPNIAVFLLGRLSQGIAGGWIAGFVYIIIGVVFAERQVVKVLAAVSAVWGAATLGGPLVGGLFAAAGDWRGVFWTFAAQALAFSVAAAFLLPRAGTRTGGPGVPLMQMLILTLAVLALGSAGLDHTLALAAALGALGVLLLLVALRVDGRARVRLLPRRAGDLASPVGVGYAALFLLPAAATGFSTYGPALLQILRVASPLTAGYAVAAEALGWSIAAVFVANLNARWSGRCIRIGAVLVAGGVVALLLTVRAAPLWVVVLAGLGQGAGFGMSWGFINQRILAELDRAEAAIGSSALGAIFSLGTAVGAALAGIAANLSGLSHGPSQSAADTAAVWVFLAALPVAALGLLAAWRLASLPPGSLRCDPT